MDPNAECGLAISIFTPGPLDDLDDELKLVRCLYGNSAGPSTLDDISTCFGIMGEKASLFIVTFEELRRRGVVEAATLGGRELYDLTKAFRDLVDSEYRKYQKRPESEEEDGFGT